MSAVGIHKIRPALPVKRSERDKAMNSIIYIIGLVVVVLFILSMLGLR